MIELEASRYVAATAGGVYDLVMDISRMGEWSPENQGGTWRDGARSPKIGARFTGRNRRTAAWKTTATVTEAGPGRAFAFVIGDFDRPQTRWRYTFASSGRGCEVTETCQILRQPGPIGRLMTRLGTGVPWSQRPDDMKEGMEETLRRLAATAEDGAAAAAKQP